MNNKNAIIAVLVLAALLFSLFTLFVSSEWDLRTNARSAILFCPDGNLTLYASNENQRLPMASTTKIMTAIVALENSKLDKTVIIDDEAVGTEGSSAYLKGGDTYTLEGLLYALLLQSANDAAVAIAINVGGTQDRFVEMMNQKAEDLNLRDTHFANPNGLDAKDHYTSAYDLARLSSYALKNADFSRIVSTKTKTVISNEGTLRTFYNHNKLLGSFDGCIGVKTGYTKSSGRCLVSAALRDGMTLVAVTLDDGDDWRDHKEMLEYGFTNYEKTVLASKHEYSYNIPLLNSSDKTTITATNKDEISVILPKKHGRIESKLKIKDYVIAPVIKDEILGKVIFTLDGKQIAEVDLSAIDSATEKDDAGFIKRIKNYIINLFSR